MEWTGGHYPRCRAVRSTTCCKHPDNTSGAFPLAASPNVPITRSAPTLFRPVTRLHRAFPSPHHGYFARPPTHHLQGDRSSVINNCCLYLLREHRPLTLWVPPFPDTYLPTRNGTSLLPPSKLWWRKERGTEERRRSPRGSRGRVAGCVQWALFVE